jgi:hypothetical protein
MGWRKKILWMILVGGLAVPGMAQRKYIGNHPDDRFLSGFWAQNLNASNLVAGLNLNAPGSITLTNTLLPSTISSKTFSALNLDGSNTVTNGATLEFLPTAGLLLGTNSFLSFTNGATVQDSTGGRVWNYQLTADGETAARYSDVTNIVSAINQAAGEWVSLSSFEATQFGTNGALMVIKDSSVVTNVIVRERLTVDGSMALKVLTVSTNYTLAMNDRVILADATSSNLVLMLPAVSTTNLVFTVKKKDVSANTVTLDGYSGEQIDGAVTLTLTNQWDKVTVISDQTQWYLIGN